METQICNIIKNNKRWILLLMCFTLFIIILFNINKIASFDTYVYNAISSFKTNTLTNIFKAITLLGSAEVLIGITLILLIFIKDKKIGGCVALNLLIIGALNQALKYIVQRPRPEGFMLIEETGYSFPSGHSMASMAFYGLIIYFVFQKVENKKAKIGICTVLSLLILLIGISRIYLGVHYASDVIAGFFLSLSYLVVYITIMGKLTKI